MIPFLLVLLIVPLLAWGFSSLLQRRDEAPPAAQSAQSQPAEVPQSEPADSLPSDADAGQPSAAPVEPEAAPEESEPAEEEPAGVNLETPVVVLNHTGIAGYAGQIAAQITDGGFTNVDADNTSGWVTQVNTVFYSTAEQEATAQKVAELAGASDVVLNSEVTVNGGITVLLIQ